ncbi:MAG: 1-aminocyclopropane-1-carboxylate deaminase/D-cysteine desulfhydrase [Myxococcota bacterium]
MPTALLRVWPQLGGRVARVTLGDFPTPIERLTRVESELALGPLYVKRDDLSSSLYGGNKVRTLEVLFGLARARGFDAITAVGAYGSNHAVASVLHGPRVGLAADVLLFPQPPSLAALENVRVSGALARVCEALPHWSFVPYAMWRARRAGRFVMAPGGATPEGALGYVGAALEVSEQIQSGKLERPREIVLGIGSCCTSAGLLVGLVLSARLGIGPSEPPRLRSVRVSPWPVTSRARVLALAAATSRLLAELCGDPSLRLSRAELGPYLHIDPGELGAGYGRPTPRGREAATLFERCAGPPLDTTYSAKSAAGFLRAARESRGDPLLYWATKSSAPLPIPNPTEAARTPLPIRRWIERAERLLR